MSTWKRAIARLGLELGYFTGIARILSRRTGGLGIILRFERVRPRVAGGFQPLRAREITPEFLDRTLVVLERYAPGLRAQVVASQLLLPADIEREFRISGGHWHHGELALDQFLMLRPIPGAAQYAMPVNGLYLCGAGCHPGGGVMGCAGRNAAQAVLGAERAS